MQFCNKFITVFLSLCHRPFSRVQHQPSSFASKRDESQSRQRECQSALVLIVRSSRAGMPTLFAVYGVYRTDEFARFGPAEHKQYRTIVGKLMFLANERPDIPYCAKECARGVQSPSARDMQRAKRICRYLMGTREWTLKLEPDREIDTLQMMVDSDWATDKVERRSTSAGVAQLGGCTMLTYSRTQGSLALSSAEAEGYALGSGACEGLFICTVAKELSVDLKLVVYSDSTATISQHSKMGLGRMKHVELRFLFVKDLVKREKLSLCKVLGTDNPPDLGTKVLDEATHRYLCHLVGLRPVKQVVEEVKGYRRNLQSSGSVGLQNVWECLRTLCLGLAQWAQENSTPMNLHELGI